MEAGATVFENSKELVEREGEKRNIQKTKHSTKLSQRAASYKMVTACDSPYRCHLPNPNKK